MIGDRRGDGRIDRNIHNGAGHKTIRVADDDCVIASIAGGGSGASKGASGAIRNIRAVLLPLEGQRRLAINIGDQRERSRRVNRAAGGKDRRVGRERGWVVAGIAEARERVRAELRFREG